MKIALTGATGFVGSWLAEELTHDGHEVTCLVRPTSNLRWIEHLDVRRVVGSVTEPETLPPFVAGQDLVIHVAGATKARSEEEYMRANAESTRFLLEAILAAGARVSRFVLISSQAAAGPSTAERPRREEDPPHPLTAYGRSKLEAEKIAMEYRADFPVTIIRPPAVYGPRDRDVFTYFQLVSKGLMPIMGKEGLVSVIFVRNLTYAIRTAMLHPGAENNIYFVADRGLYSWRQLGHMIAHALHRRPRSVRVPLALIHIAALFSQTYSSLTRKPVLLNREKLLEIRQPYWTISTEKAERDWGFSPPYSTEQAIQQTADWYVKEGWL